MLVAYHLAKDALPEFSSKFSGKDFSKPQLFACLVLKEFEKKDYRGVEQLLWDWPEARRAIGLAKAPDHTTLHRAAKALLSLPQARKLLDQLVVFPRTCRVLGKSVALGKENGPGSINLFVSRGHDPSKSVGDELGAGQAAGAGVCVGLFEKLGERKWTRFD